MTDDTTEAPATGKPAKPVQLRCTVLINGTVVGKLKLAKGHKLHLPEREAKALASLNPPAVKIDGI
jgi:hypothetical protein